jgi:hypothetical protein
MFRRLLRAWARFKEYQSDPTSRTTTWENAKLAWELSAYDPHALLINLLLERPKEQQARDAKGEK